MFLFSTAVSDRIFLIGFLNGLFIGFRGLFMDILERGLLGLCRGLFSGERFAKGLAYGMVDMMQRWKGLKKDSCSLNKIAPLNNHTS